MASGNRIRDDIEHLGVHLSEHPAWTHAFSDEQQLKQLSEDLFASRSVVGVLVTIVSMGLVLALTGVLLCV